MRFPVSSDIASFARAMRRELRPYQLECARAILRSVHRGEGDTFTVMFARQMGKNETSAAIEAYLMETHAELGGCIVKAAPTFRPQITTSRERLRQMLVAHPHTSGKWERASGNVLRLGRASTTFLSGAPGANVVGATASLLLEIDEAQDFDAEKYTRDFRPMASSTNATTVLYGTAWAADTLLERQKLRNLELERCTGRRLHFEYNWRVLAAIDPRYDRFVRAEIERLGEDHPSIQTQYSLVSLADAGRMFSVEQRRMLQGTHRRLRAPYPGETYVAGIDVAGRDEEAADAVARALKPRRDSTVIAIARLRRDGDAPAAEVVETVWWTGRHHEDQLRGIEELWERWRFSRVCLDASGIGYGLSQLLERRHGPRLESVTFSRRRKSELAYTLLGMVNTGRFTLYAHDQSPEARQMWWEIEHARYEMREHETMRWEVPAVEGHDDFVVALALCATAASHAPRPAHGLLLRSVETDGGW